MQLSIMSLILETELANIITLATSKIIESSSKILALSVASNLDVSEDVKNLLENSAKELRQNNYFDTIDEKELKEILEDNIEIISSWIFNPYLGNFHTDDVKVFPSDSTKKIAILRGIHGYIKKHKTEYRSIGFSNLSNQITSSANAVRSDIAKVQDDTSAIRSILDTVLNNQNKEQLYDSADIKLAIQNREYKKADILLDSLYSKLQQHGTTDDKESFYSYRVTLDVISLTNNKEKLFCDLDRLIEFTADEKLRKYRETIKLIYEGNYEGALTNIEENFADGRTMYSELKAYILFNMKKYDELLEFVDKLDEKEKVIWQLRTYLNTQNFSCGFELANSNLIKKSTDFETKFLRLQILTYYILDKKYTSVDLPELSNEVLKEIEAMLFESNDDSHAKSELLTSKMLLCLSLGTVDYNDILPYITELDALNCENPNYLKNKGIYYLSKNDYEKAFMLLDDWCKKYPDADLTKELRAIAYIGYDVEKARAEFTALPDTKENLPIKIKIFESYMREYLFDKAFEVLQILEKKNTESSYIYNAYGDYYCAIQDYAEAFNYFIRALSYQDTNVSKIDIFDKALRIALASQDTKEIYECSKYTAIINNKDALHYYCGEIVSLFIKLQDFDKALTIIEQYKSYSFNYDSLVNYWEILCLFNAHRFGDVLKIYSDDNSQIIERRDVNQKYKAYIISAINARTDLSKAKSMYKLLLPVESEIEALEREWMLSKLSDNKLKYIKQCLEDLKKYPDSIRIMENFLYACVDYGLQNLSSEQEISTVFADCTIRFMNAPNEQKTGRIGFYPMKLPL